MIFAAIYYLSPTGNDSSGNGSISSPWFTLKKAWTVVAAGDTIYLRGGIYKYNSRQTLANKNGTSGNYIHVFAYQNEIPVLTTGGSWVTPSWPNVLVYVEPGDYIHTARKTKGKDEWFVGGITDENARTATISFDYLPAGKNFIATIYADAKDASWNVKPQNYTVTKVVVTSKTILKQYLATGGGVAISIKEGTPAEIKGLKKI